VQRIERGGSYFQGGVAGFQRVQQRREGRVAALAGGAAGAGQALLDRRDRVDGQLDAEVAAGDHDAVGGLEDLGDRVFGSEVGRGRPLAELWGPAVDVLVALAGNGPPDLLPIEGHEPYRLRAYDAEAMLIEASLLIDWFWPALHGRELPPALAEEFAALWRPLLVEAEKADLGWVLRDYHSPNLMWLPEREGIRQVGILDFQDALKGPLAYDLVSLLQDARLDVPEPLERELLARYCAARGAHSQHFSSDQFVSLYATLGAQRNSKILGIFARLAKRDGKRGYLAHMPRVAHYLERDLAHPALAVLRRFYAREFPAAQNFPPLVL